MRPTAVTIYCGCGTVVSLTSLLEVICPCGMRYYARHIYSGVAVDGTMPGDGVLQKFRVEWEYDSDGLSRQDNWRPAIGVKIGYWSVHSIGFDCSCGRTIAMEPANPLPVVCPECGRQYRLNQMIEVLEP